VDAQFDNLNCGACGNICHGGTVCSTGACELSCQAGQVACGGAYVDPQTCATYCGASGLLGDAGRDRLRGWADLQPSSRGPADFT
jgi:hypothetical protein